MSKFLIPTRPMSVVGALKRARELLSDPARWTKKAFARGSDGQPEAATSPKAVSFCAYGAIRNIGTEDRILLRCINRLTDAIWDRTGVRHASVYCFNDDPRTTHSDLLEVFDEAIRLEKKKA